MHFMLFETIKNVQIEKPFKFHYWQQITLLEIYLIYELIILVMDFFFKWHYSPYGALASRLASSQSSEFSLHLLPTYVVRDMWLACRHT